MVLDDRVVSMLDDLGLERFIENFEEEEVSYADLQLLTEDDLVQLGVMTIGPRRRLLGMIAASKTQEEAGPLLNMPPLSRGSDNQDNQLKGLFSEDHGGDNTFREGTPQSARVDKAFKAVDTDNDGLVDVAEFVRAVTTLNPEVSEQSAAETFSAYDNDGSGQLDLQEFIVAYNMVRQDFNRPRSTVEAEDTTPNLCNGKHFVGSKGGGRYVTVGPREDEKSDQDGAIVCDMFDDGSFVYKYEANHDDMPDGPEVLDYFLEGLFGTTVQPQGPSKVDEIRNFLQQGGVNSMEALRAKSKRELDDFGIPIGPRAKITGSAESWRPPKYNDESFILRGRWQAKDCGPVTQVRFIVHEEEFAAYDGVRVPSKMDYTLDASFVPSGACRAMNGNMPAASGLRRAFLTFTTDPREEEEVNWVKTKKDTILNLCGGKLSKLSLDVDWVLKEYQFQTEELVESGGCYVDQPQVKRSQEKLAHLKSTIDQCVAVFEDYYGSVQ
eukprot:TRINITY_DN24054_c0_g1_i1.p1 TRINITY_DN24054_c0_g1~~TRINITY_DN24054_c0_g1_i1.p1  ORF type:complete len:495 (+),score=129.97 TRINITY_DN24054_c0_g1_i1:148-1632(+)